MNGTATEDYFRLSDSGSIEQILWQRMKDNPISLISSNLSQVQQILLSNPFAVFFGQDTVVEFELQEFPCKIVTTSKKLSRVERSFITSHFF
jgi:hypothetical protein